MKKSQKSSLPTATVGETILPITLGGAQNYLFTKTQLKKKKTITQTAAQPMPTAAPQLVIQLKVEAKKITRGPSYAEITSQMIEKRNNFFTLMEEVRKLNRDVLAIYLRYPIITHRSTLCRAATGLEENKARLLQARTDRGIVVKTLFTSHVREF